MVREESQDDLGIAKAQDLDHFNKYFSPLLQPVLKLKKTSYKNLYTKIKIYIFVIDKFHYRYDNYCGTIEITCRNC